MEPIYNEEEVSMLVDNFSKKVTEKLKADLLDSLYQDVSNYLYEHYQNFHEKIERDLIKSICGEYTKDPTQYKFADLRKTMFNENKEELTKILTDEAIEKSVEDVIEKYTHRDYHFEWRWKDGISKIILEKWDNFKDDERIKQQFGRELDRRQERINWLENKLREVSDVLED